MSNPNEPNPTTPVARLTIESGETCETCAFINAKPYMGIPCRHMCKKFGVVVSTGDRACKYWRKR